VFSGNSATASHRFQAQAVEEGKPKDQSVGLVVDVLCHGASSDPSPYRRRRLITAHAV